MQNRIRLIILATFLVTPWAHAQEQEAAEAEAPPAAGQVNAADLIKNAQRAVGQVVRIAQGDPALAQGNAKAKPFWDGLKDLNENLDKAQTGLALKDNTFFSAIASAGSGFAQADVGRTMSGSTDQTLASSMASLESILRALHENYSKEAARLKQGGELSATERQQLEKLQAQQDVLLEKLDTVEKNAAKNNEEMQKAIAKMREEAKKIKRSRRNTAGFVGGFFAASFLYDWMWGWHWWWGPWGGWCPDFIIINVDIWDDWIDYYDYDWDLVDDYLDVGELGLEDELAELEGFGDEDIADTTDFFDSNDFSLGDDDMREMTSDLDLGWDDAGGDFAAEAMDSYQQNFEQESYHEPEMPIETFDDAGISDFGGDFGGMDFDF